MASSSSTTINLGIASFPENTKDQALWNELVKVYNALNILARTIDSYTGSSREDSGVWSQLGTSTIRSQNINKMYIPFTDTVLAGAMIHVYNNAGDLNARLAKAADGTKPARAFASAAVNAGDYGEIIFFGLSNNFSGLTPGQLYYLSDISVTGQISAAKPVALGTLVQPVGFALSDTELFFNPVLDGDIN